MIQINQLALPAPSALLVQVKEKAGVAKYNTLGQAYSSEHYRSGGDGGGGYGGSFSDSGGSGAANTGGGGGGCGQGATYSHGGAGGSGIVIIRRAKA